MEQLLGLPPDASAHGPALDHLTVLIHWLMLVLFVGWGSFYVYTLIRFRQKANPKASYTGVKNHFSSYIEGFVALIEVILLISFSIPLWANRVNSFPNEKDAVVIRVVGEQFAWNIRYSGPDGKFGRTIDSLVESDNPLGLDRSDPDAKDDIVTLNQLTIPVDKPVIIQLTTKDVIHSFFLPYLRVKQDAIPGEQIPLWFTAVKTSVQVREEVTEMTKLGNVSMTMDKVSNMTAGKDYAAKDGSMIIKSGEMIGDSAIAQLEAMGMKSMDVMPDLSSRVAMVDVNGADGTPVVKKGEAFNDEIVQKLNAMGMSVIKTAPGTPMEIACAQLCGLGHYRMRGYLNIVTQDEFAAWIKDQEAQLNPEAEASTPAASDSTSVATATDGTSVPQAETQK